MRTHDRLRIAIQKSGRLSDPARDLLARAGLAFRESRDRLFCYGESLPIDLLLVRDDDIPGLIAEGTCDLGVVGQNVLEEQALERAADAPMLAFEIVLDKRIPVAAGLGGGSSDAAATLWGLNRLWGLGLTRSQLSAIGLTLGADVPFFIGGRNAWVEGIGEQLTPVALPPGRFVVVKPPSGASTAAIFGSPILKRDTKPAILSGFAADAQQNPDQIWDFGANDLQAVAQAVCPEISDCIAWLSRKGLQARMTGSGSAVFAPWVDGVDLSDTPPGWQVKICSNWAEHPLRAWCEG